MKINIYFIYYYNLFIYYNIVQLCLHSSKLVTVCSAVSILFDILSKLMELLFSTSIIEFNDFVSDELNVSIPFKTLKPKTKNILEFGSGYKFIIKLYHYYTISEIFTEVRKTDNLLIVY